MLGFFPQPTTRLAQYTCAMMRIALIGYGKMGHEIELAAQERGHSVVRTFGSSNPPRAEDLSECDVAIEFSTPHTVVENIFTCFAANCPVVVGATGWYGQFQEVKAEALRLNQTMLYATNFSIGVNVFFHLNKELARIMNNLENYEPSLVEIHHAAKLDKPSGTAITIAEGILDNVKRKTTWVNDEEHQAAELSIVSEREGEVPGTHTVYYTSSVDTLSMTHQAHNRKGFAMGAVQAAEWIKNKKGVFTMNDFLQF